MATESPYGSNNPFRRKSTDPTTTSSSTLNDPPPPSSSQSNRNDAFDSNPRPPFTTFKSALSADTRDYEAESLVQPKPKKIVKKVRVQSPPPSSPEDIIPVTSRFPELTDTDDSEDEPSHGNHGSDPFNRPALGSGAGQLDGTSSRPPANPFSKTLQDMEHSGQAGSLNGSQAGSAKGSMDVDAFKRLLLTGQSNAPGPKVGSSGNTSAQTPLHDGASTTDTSSISRQSIFDAVQETPRTSHELSELEDGEERRTVLPSSPLATTQSTPVKKKPPPPSSRHGKLIKLDLGGSDTAKSSQLGTTNQSADSSSDPRAQSPPSDVNKPLPLPPRRPSFEEESESIFDREAAGKLPEPRPPTPPAGHDHPQSESSAKKPPPAAPPPRRHKTSESKANTASHSEDKEENPRSSLESNRSRADSLRVNIANNAPAPPPPRRPNHTRSGSSFTSPSGASFTSMSSPSASEAELSPQFNSSARPQGHLDSIAVGVGKDGLPKLSPPPPPPARHSSTRRPSSISSVDMIPGSTSRRPPSISSMEIGNAGSRRLSRDKEGGAPPPPPPPRQRGSSRGSMDVPKRRDSVRTLGSPVVEEGSTPGSSTGLDGARENAAETLTTSSDPQALGPTAGADILADLEALQKEVDALRGQYGK